jgi:high-affinity nickel-transport protein
MASSTHTRVTITNTKRIIIAMSAVIGALLVLGWGTFLSVVLPGRYVIGDSAIFGWGIAITAFFLGVRHAFDADHIAAIDNTTRKLVEEGKRPVSVGFWFAIGHSTVVVATVALLAAGIHSLASQFSQHDSAIYALADKWGAAVSGVFLLMIGLVNLASLAGINRAFRDLKSGQYSDEQLEAVLRDRGISNRFLGGLARTVDRPRKMWLIGLLFGLGFDTASTIALLVVSSGASQLAPWYVVMVPPILFTAGMTIFDTADGILMNRSYQWAFAHPMRKIYYNFTVTAMSVAVAFCIGLLVLLGLFADSFAVKTGPFAWLATIDLGNAGFVIVAVLLATWLGAMLYWKRAGIER